MIKPFKVFESSEKDISELQDMFLDAGDLESVKNIKVRKVVSWNSVSMLRHILSEEEIHDMTVFNITYPMILGDSLYEVIVNGNLSNEEIRSINKRCSLYGSFSFLRKDNIYSSTIHGLVTMQILVYIKDKDKVVKEFQDVIKRAKYPDQHMGKRIRNRIRKRIKKFFESCDNHKIEGITETELLNLKDVFDNMSDDNDYEFSSIIFNIPDTDRKLILKIANILTSGKFNKSEYKVPEVRSSICERINGLLKNNISLVQITRNRIPNYKDISELNRDENILDGFCQFYIDRCVKYTDMSLMYIIDKTYKRSILFIKNRSEVTKGIKSLI